MYYHYSNPSCQGAKICKTVGCPERFDKIDEYEIHSIYSDRLWEWDKDRCKKVNELIGGDDQVWAYKLGKLSDNKLRKIGKIAFKLNKLPDHMKFVFYYNVSSGYACPVIVAYVKKQEAINGNSN